MVKLITQSSAILIHINNTTLSLWNTLVENDLSNLIKPFIKKLESLSSNVFLSIESENETSKNFAALLSEKKPVENIPYQHELNLLHLLMLDKSFDNIIYFDSIYPMLDLKLVENLLNTHEQYGADYSYGENVPAGILPPIFGKTLFEALRIQDSDDSKNSDLPELSVPLNSYLEKNLNNFHVEIHYEHPDLRMHRLNFACKTKRSIVNSTRVLSNISNIDTPYQELQPLYSKKPELLFNFPSYIELEVNGSCEYKCTFCARQFRENNTDDHITIDGIEKVISYCSTVDSDISIGLGGYGEPLEHPDIERIITLLLDAPSIKTIILETNALYLNKISSIIEHKHFNKLQVVININGIKEYTNIHGVSKEAETTVFNNLTNWSEKLKASNLQPQSNTHLQMLKIIENETEVDELFALAEKLGFSFLLQKYNSAAGKMPEKRVSDMTPMERSFCWHLRRDLFIYANGDLAFCKQDIEKQLIRGNIYENSLENLWASQEKDWVLNYQENYPDNSPCANCDEYFTFNL